jgi:hypothetical protein
VFPIQAPIFNSETNVVPEPVITALPVLHVTVPVKATFGKLLVKCIGELVVAILTLSVAIFADSFADPLAVYTYDAIF